MSGTTKEQDLNRACNAWRERYTKSRCAICGEIIVGKACRKGEGKYVCTRCNNETPGT